MRLFPLFLLSIPLLAAADMTITADEQVSQAIKPDVLRGSLHYQEVSKSSETIKKDLNAIVAEVKRRDPKGEQCRGGGYYVSPRYSYKDGKQVFEGYTGSLSFTCTFDAIEPYNKLTAAVDKVSAQGIRKTQGALNWVVSEKSRTALQETLRGEVIAKAAGEAKRYASLTGGECSVASVNFGGTSYPEPVLMRSTMAMAEASAPTESPMLSDEEVTVSASVVYKCERAAL
jgi:hypothetical protein